MTPENRMNWKWWGWFGFSQNCVNQENAHFYMAEMMLCASEQVRWRERLLADIGAADVIGGCSNVATTSTRAAVGANVAAGHIAASILDTLNVKHSNAHANLISMYANELVSTSCAHFVMCSWHRHD
jgi:hypothetical protein